MSSERRGRRGDILYGTAINGPVIKKNRLTERVNQEAWDGWVRLTCLCSW